MYRLHATPFWIDMIVSGAHTSIRPLPPEDVGSQRVLEESMGGSGARAEGSGGLAALAAHVTLNR